MKTKNIKQPIIILGGMGPQASAELVRLIIKLATKKFSIKEEKDFPEIILDSIPVPDCIDGTEFKNQLINMLRKRILKLNAFNPFCFSIACNTVHLFLPYLQTVTKKPFISLINEVVEQVKKKNIKTVGLMASPLTLKSRLYQDESESENINVILPTKIQSNILNEVIRNVISGKKINENRKKLLKIARDLKNRGAEAIILGCTELPLLFPKKFDLPIFNSLEILAFKLLKSYYKFDNIN